ncbi:MAG TPA: ABC transporter permease [Candidatus Polarisedimenticolaceae bacterium]
MRRVLHIAANDLRLTLRDRAAFFWLLLLPVGMMWIFGSMGGGPRKAALTVVDRDGGWVAKALCERLDLPGVELTVVADEPAGKPPLRKLVLPPGFTENVLAGRQQRLEVEAAEGANSDYTRAADAYVLRAIVKTLAAIVELRRDGIPADPAAAMAALASREPLVKLEVSTAGSGRPVPSGRAQSVPGILTMTVLMMTVIYGAVFLTLEKRDGTLRRQLAGPLTPGQVFAGKVLGRVYVAAMQLVVLLGFGRFLFGVDLGRSPAGLALLIGAYAFCVAAVATLFGAWLRSPEQASAIGWLASMVMAALGGCWWPSEVVPRWLWQVAHVFPTAWAMDGFHALISFGKGIDGVAVPSAALFGMGIIILIVGRRIRGLWGE